MVKRLSVVVCLFVACVFALAQEAEWTAKIVPPDTRPGESAQVVITAKIKPEWHVYSINTTEGPLPTSFDISGVAWLEVNGETVEPPPVVKDDPNFGAKIGQFEGAVSFAVPVKIKVGVTGEQKGVLTAKWMACSSTTCTPPRTTEIEIAFSPQAGSARGDRMAAVTSIPEQPEVGAPQPGEGTVSGDANSSEIEQALSKGLLPFLLISFIAGLGALLTPCVFPMVPITVSYFSKRAENNQGGVVGAGVYSLGIMATFTVLGVVVAAIFGGSKIADFATHPITNITLAVLFIVLALNLFGVYEIRLPSWLVRQAHEGTKASGFFGPFAMGMTFTLTSFTCTVGFVGALLAKAATGGAAEAVLGMLAFSVAFASPFFLLALFPQYLSKVPKAGGWMTSVKVFMGFIEIAAAVKFLSNADLAWQTGIMPRAVFLAVWAVIFIISALYLFGWLHLASEHGASKPGLGRLATGALTLLIGGYCLAGVGGKSLGEIEAFLPPGDQDIPWMTNYDDALARAKSENKPIFINFTGAQCTNCRWMEQNMFTRNEVHDGILEYIPVELYTDRQSDEDRKNQELQKKLTGLDTLPVYVIVSPEGKPLRRFEGSTRNAEKFITFLRAEPQVRVASR